MDLGPKNEAEKQIFAVEAFCVDVQHCIHKLMRDRGVDQRELAKLLDVTELEVVQMFSDECRITVRILAHIFFVLSDECSISSNRLEELKQIEQKDEDPYLMYDT